MVRCKLLTLISLAWASVLSLVHIQSHAESLTLRVVTEDSYPLQYVQDGQLIGPALELVEKVLVEAGVDYEVEVLPWARAYATAEVTPNTLIFSMARTTQREPLFHWIGAIMSLDYHFYGLKALYPKEKYTPDELRDARIGTILGSATYQHLIAENYENLYAVASPKLNFEKLLSKRIDIFPANELSFAISCTQFVQDCDQIRSLASIGVPATELYFAMSQSSNPELVKKIKAAYQTLIEEQRLADELSQIANIH